MLYHSDRNRFLGLTVSDLNVVKAASKFRFLSAAMVVILTLLFSGCVSSPEKKSKQDIVNVKAKKGDVLATTYRSPFSAQNWSAKAKQKFNKGVVFLKKGQTKAKATKAFYAAITLAPSMEPAYFNIAKMAIEHRTTQSMLKKIMQLAQKNNMESPRLLSVFAVGLRKQSQFAEAKKLYSRAIKLNNSYLPAILNMAILEDVYLGNLKSAQIFYLNYQQQLIIQGKKDKRLKNWLADLKQRLKKLDGAGK